MVAPLRPVEAETQAGTTPRRRYPEIAQPGFSCLGHHNGLAACRDEPALFEGVGQRHTQTAGEMGIARACKVQRVRTPRLSHGGMARAFGDIGQCLQRMPYLLVGDPVVPEPPLGHDGFA